jgi:hypothetical protein
VIIDRLGKELITVLYYKIINARGLAILFIKWIY